MTGKKAQHAGGHIELGAGSEFDIVRAMLDGFGDAASGIGDDAAVLQVPPNEKVVVSTDTSVEGVHFRREWLDHSEIGYRAMAAALSDLAAMAAQPLGAVVALTLPKADRSKARVLATGIGAAASASNCQIIGGDLSGGTTFSITVTVLGSAVRPMSRAGARTGDLVYVTGSLGGPAAAVKAWVSGNKPNAEHRARFARPVPRIEAALALATAGATSLIDISDGLMSDLAHIAAASGARIEIDLERIPCVAGVTAWDAAGSGEEYELAVTASSIDTGAFSRDVGLRLTEIGRIVAGAPGVVLLDKGKSTAIPAGYDHFRNR
jgi:thiamine-monophosphate kinase